MRQIFFSLFTFLLCSTLMNAQDRWNLQECVNYAQERSLEVKSGALQIARAETNLETSKQQRYPNLNGSISYGTSYGKSIDPSTNSFVTQGFDFNTYGLNAGVTLFNWGRINNSINADKLGKQVAIEESEQTKDDVALGVVSAFLNVMLAQDNLENTRNSLANTQQQLDRMLKLIEAGSQPEAARYDLEAQVATQEQEVVLAQNRLDLAVLELKHLMRYDSQEELQIERPDIDRIMVEESAILEVPVDQIYARALETQHQIIASNIREQAAEIEEKVARASFYPRLTVGGSLDTRYSSEGVAIAGTETVVNEVPVNVNIPDIGFDGEAVIGFPSSQPIFEDNPYFDQLDENLGYGYGITLSVPIYNNNQVNNAVSLARINTEQTRINNEILRQNLRTNILSARTDALASRKALDAAIKSVEASEISLNNLQRQLELGAGNNFDFIIARNNLSIAQNRLLNARYNYIFSLKVLDYYLGNPITF